jgi:hypothetical protein
MDENASVIAEQSEEVFSNFGVREAALKQLEESLGKQPLPELLTPKDDVTREPKEITRARVEA